MNHLKNGKSVHKIDEISNLSASTLQHMIKHEAPNKIFRASGERQIIWKLKANRKLSGQKLVVDVQQKLGKKIREHDFNDRVARKKTFFNKKKKKNMSVWSGKYL